MKRQKLSPEQMAQKSNRYAQGAERIRLSARMVSDHSSLVRSMRVGLPVLAGFLLALFALSASPASEDKSFAKQFAYLDKPTQDFQMDQPRYAGEDASGRPYEISASTARQNPQSPNLIRLEALDGIRSPETSDQIKVKADTGLFKTDEQTLDLSINVEMEQGIGGRDYVLKTSAATVALESRELVSDVGVSGENDKGSFIAEKMTVYQQEGRVVAEGGVSMRIEPKKQSDSQKEPE